MVSTEEIYNLERFPKIFITIFWHSYETAVVFEQWIPKW